MPASRSDLADFLYFVAIAKRLSFRGAAAELGVGAPTLSQSMRGLEGRLGVRLFDRTRSSVVLTEAGGRLLQSIEDPLRLIDQAVEDIGDLRDGAGARLRIAVSDGADVLLLAPVMAAFATRCPDVTVRVCTDAACASRAGEGPDCWIGLEDGPVGEGEIVPLGGDLRWLTVAAPSYIRRMGEPTDPEQLRSHRCIGFRAGGAVPDRWRFAGPKGGFEIAVICGSVWDGAAAAVAAAAAGEGVVQAPEPLLEGMLATGALHPLLEEWTASLPGYRLRRSVGGSMPAALRVLVELIADLPEAGATSDIQN